VAVIGSEVREELFPRVDPIGRTVWIDGLPHKVVGLFGKQGQLLGQSRDLVVHTPFRAASKRFGKGDGLSVQTALLVRAKGGVEGVDRAQEEVVQVFRWLRHTPLLAGDPVGAVTAEMLQIVWRAISAMLYAVVGAIAGMSLLVGTIVVANIMLFSVTERTQEIGVRRAMGARRSDIRRQFLIEAAFLAAVGGIIGSALGAVTAWVVASQSPVPAAVRLTTVVMAIAVASISGIVAGYFPARKAARLLPVDALRHE
jgi:putative ABC transport system permease protein